LEGWTEGNATGRAEGWREGNAAGQAAGRAEGWKEGNAAGQATGRAQGWREGNAAGQAAGRAEEREDSIYNLLKVIQEFHQSSETALAQLKDKYQLEGEAAEKYMRLYWDGYKSN
jgi:hypothetical protein